MKRDCGRLQGHLFDLLIIGGGIHGATAARKLAASGYDVALVEKGDFCQATSFNSLKILHGGLRYLQHADFKRMRESIRARREFMRLAPHLVRPLPCLMPTKGFGIHGKLVMGVALFVNDCISYDRNHGLEKAKHLPRGGILGRAEAEKCIPGLADRKISGAALWYDALLLNSERMLLLLLHQAAGHGAVLANYVAAEKLADKGEYQEVTARDLLHGESFTIKSKMVINCAGPWLDELIGSAASPSEVKTGSLAKAVNIVVDRNLFAQYGVGIEGSREYSDKDVLLKRGKRLFFFVPWRGKTMIGTTYSHCELSEDKLYTTQNDIRDMVAEVNSIYPPADLNEKDVIFSHVGLVPAYSPEEQEALVDPRLMKHSEIIDHGEREQRNGLLSVRGVKYTTAPQVARDLEKLLRKKGLLARGSGSDNENDDVADARHMHQDLADSFPHIEAQYGEQSSAIFQLMASEADSQVLLSDDPPLSRAELLFAIREEMACHLADMVLRRSELGTCGCPPKTILVTVAGQMAKELNWSDEQRDEEVEKVIGIYRKMNIRLP